MGSHHLLTHMHWDLEPLLGPRPDPGRSLNPMPQLLRAEVGARSRFMGSCHLLTHMNRDLEPSPSPQEVTKTTKKNSMLPFVPFAFVVVNSQPSTINPEHQQSRFTERALK